MIKQTQSLLKTPVGLPKPYLLSDQFLVAGSQLNLEQTRVPYKSRSSETNVAKKQGPHPASSSKLSARSLVRARSEEATPSSKATSTMKVAKSAMWFDGHTANGQYFGSGYEDQEIFGPLEKSILSTPLSGIAFGAQIETIQGPKNVQRLKEGDMIKTMDNGFQRLSWVGRNFVEINHKNPAVRFEKGVLNNAEALVVSPDHKMLISSWENELHFDEFEVFVEARHLLGRNGVDCVRNGGITYFLLLLDDHQVIFANGAPCESFLPNTMNASAPQLVNQQDEIDVHTGSDCNLKLNDKQTARVCLDAKEACLITLSNCVFAN